MGGYSFRQQSWEAQRGKIPGLVNIARIAIVLPLLIFQLLSTDSALNPDNFNFPSVEFYSWVLLYTFLIFLTIFRPDWQLQSLDLPNASAAVDISMMMLLVYVVGGLETGLGILVLPFVATSCLLSYGRYPMLYASYTAMLIVFNLLLGEGIRFNPLEWYTDQVLRAVILIGAAYLVAFLISFVTGHLKEANESAEHSQQAVNQLSGVNRMVINSVQEAVVVIDAAQQVWFFNRKAKVYFPAMMVGFHETAFSELVQRWHVFPEKSFETDIRVAQQVMHVRAVPLIQEEGEFLILYIRSLREVAAEAMSTKLASLGQLTSNLAHEIRNPMSAIRHASDLLQEGEEDGVKCKLYGIIDSNIRRIDKMLEEVSMMNKRDGFKREAVNLMKFWLSFKQEFVLNNPQAVGCIHMRMDGNNLTAVADVMHLQQIMWNLCNNAWKHSRQDENAVTVLMRPSGYSHISIVVSDNGQGVPVENRSRLFDPFFTTDKKSGTGLGLYVALELAHANFGQLQYRPEMNGFELILPKESNE
ncbi:ATP-binding protein [Neisseria animalis]|uniref:histidine kinase n=1 Tax=Neisseria animalis TaxID=492 RepID=A0A5P3MQ85_NEIAN|nr:ATP-binding protein [Neisseria animalis]QEY23726.1 sensor histidine kinase [Neisseria animalis]ROW32868.1 sensor histidine kinase [Neisseria animalis]VEE09568.1 two-component system sensor protein [Neisseria animalis]